MSAEEENHRARPRHRTCLDVCLPDMRFPPRIARSKSRLVPLAAELVRRCHRKSCCAQLQIWDLLPRTCSLLYATIIRMPSSCTDALSAVVSAEHHMLGLEALERQGIDLSGLLGHLPLQLSPPVLSLPLLSLPLPFQKLTAAGRSAAWADRQPTGQPTGCLVGARS